MLYRKRIIYGALIPSTIIFADEGPISKTFGDTPFTNAVTGGYGDGAITYVSGDPAIATVEAATGEVTIVAPLGSTIIMATKAATGTHEETTNIYIINVVTADQVAANAVDTLITTLPAAGAVVWADQVLTLIQT